MPTDPLLHDNPTIDAVIRRAVDTYPTDVALVDAPNRASFFHGPPQRLTWAEVDQRVAAIAAQLESAGIGSGMAVAIQLPNVVELPLTILACLRIDAVAVPFPIQHRGHELRHGLPLADVRAVVTSARPDRPEQLGDMSGIVGDLGREITILSLATEVDGSDQASGDSILVLDPTVTGRPRTVASTDVDAIATICWTSGTTGMPKGVPRTHAMWLASGTFQVDQLAITHEDRILCPFPVVNMAGIGGMLLPWAIAGATLHLHQPLDLPVFLQQLAGEAITYTVAPPPLLNMLLANPAMLEDVDLRHLRLISSGSAPLDPWMVAGWQERGIEIVNVFGSNEGAAMLSTASAVPDPTERARYFPRPEREGVRIRLVDLTTGAEIEAPGEPGELRFAGPTVFGGYLDSSGDEFDEEGFYRTGDVFEWAGDDQPPSLLRFIDRAKDIVIRGGMNVSAAEVEALVSSHDRVAECAAVGYPDRDLGERLGVFVVPMPEAPPPSLEDLLAHLRLADVASYKLPERIEILTELPRNAVGKVTKPDLRERWSTPDTTRS